jgi:hypothetical protein
MNDVYMYADRSALETFRLCAQQRNFWRFDLKVARSTMSFVHSSVTGNFPE